MTMAVIYANGGALAMCLCFYKHKNGKGIATNAMLSEVNFAK